MTETDETVPVYQDIAFDLGVTAHRPYSGEDLKPSTGWHSEFQDVNNDGLWDLFIAKGNVEAMPDFAAFDPDNLLIGQWNGKFVEAGDTAGIGLDRRGRGGGLADFNADGLLDLIVVNRAAPVSLFRNLGQGTADTPRPLGNWLAVDVRQPGGVNTRAVGAKISVKTGNRTVVKDIQVGAGHASGSDGIRPFRPWCGRTCQYAHQMAGRRLEPRLPGVCQQTRHHRARRGKSQTLVPGINH